MKKLICIIIIGLAIAGCSKKSMPKPAAEIPTVSGKFRLIQNSDTLYKDDNIAKGVAEILNQNASGDTSYLNPGTPQLIVQANPLVNYNPVTAMTDTLNFTSTSAGVRIQAIGTFPFSYDLPTHYFNNHIADGTVSEKLYKINTTTIKLVITQTDGLYIGSTRALYYIK